VKIVSTLGGGGSTYVFVSLDRLAYRPLLGCIDTYRLKKKLHRRPHLWPVLNRALHRVRLYRPEYVVLKRPDAFWTNWDVHPSGVYDPRAADFRQHLIAQRDYLVETRHARSASFDLKKEDLAADSLPSLASSYLKKVGQIEAENDFTTVLISCHWGEYGVFQQLDVEAVYLIRDPFNSLISHSKPQRHRVDYQRRGLKLINTTEWIDTYLSGPHHHWINHARVAAGHRRARPVRYDRFPEEWPKLSGLPDITKGFRYMENDVSSILTRRSREYIYEKTRDLCEALGMGALCARYAAA